MRSSTAVTVLTGLISFCAGTLLVILPWSAFWDHNHFFQLWPPLETILVNDVARIAVTSLGLIDFVLGLTEVRRLTHPSEPGPVARS